MSRLVFGCVAGLVMSATIGCVPESKSASQYGGDEASEPRQREEFASDRGQNAKVAPVDFDAKRAMTYLERICDIGPRISGSDGMKKQQELVKKHFEEY